MVECYSVFCSHHNESINFYKEQLQNNKKMQILMRVRKAAKPPTLCVQEIHGCDDDANPFFPDRK